MARVYLDSCIVIFAVESPESSGRPILEKLYSGAVESPEVFVSDLTKMECVVGPIRDGDVDGILAFRDFFDHPDTHLIAPSSTVFDRATQIRAKTGIATPDALHIAFALESGCAEFWTNDLRLQKAAGEAIEMTLPIGP